MKKLILALTVAAIATLETLAAMNYVRPSGSVSLEASGEVASGALVQVGESGVWGVAMSGAPSGASFIAYTSGVFEFTQDSTNAVAVGAPLYCVATNAAMVTATSSTNATDKVGICVGTSASGQLQVDLNR